MFFIVTTPFHRIKGSVFQEMGTGVYVWGSKHSAVETTEMNRDCIYPHPDLPERAGDHVSYLLAYHLPSWCLAPSVLRAILKPSTGLKILPDSFI